MIPKLLDARELSQALGYSPVQILSWARRGLIPRVKSGSRVYFNVDRVVEAIRTLPDDSLDHFQENQVAEGLVADDDE
jgi:hypothetical protein